MTQAGAIMEATVMRPKQEKGEAERSAKENICADKGYDFEIVRSLFRDHGYVEHVRARGEEARAIKDCPGFKARRWVVEVTNAWLNRFRKLLVRYEKTTSSYNALLCLAAAIIALRKTGIIYG